MDLRTTLTTALFSVVLALCGCTVIASRSHKSIGGFKNTDAATPLNHMARRRFSLFDHIGSNYFSGHRTIYISVIVVLKSKYRIIVIIQITWISAVLAEPIRNLNLSN